MISSIKIIFLYYHPDSPDEAHRMPLIGVDQNAYENELLIVVFYFHCSEQSKLAKSGLLVGVGLRTWESHSRIDSQLSAVDLLFMSGARKSANRSVASFHPAWKTFGAVSEDINLKGVWSICLPLKENQEILPDLKIASKNYFANFWLIPLKTRQIDPSRSLRTWQDWCE